MYLEISIKGYISSCLLSRLTGQGRTVGVFTTITVSSNKISVYVSIFQELKEVTRSTRRRNKIRLYVVQCEIYIEMFLNILWMVYICSCFIAKRMLCRLYYTDISYSSIFIYSIPCLHSSPNFNPLQAI